MSAQHVMNLSEISKAMSTEGFEQRRISILIGILIPKFWPRTTHATLDGSHEDINRAACGLSRGQRTRAHYLLGSQRCRITQSKPSIQPYFPPLLGLLTVHGFSILMASVAVGNRANRHARFDLGKPPARLIAGGPFTLHMQTLHITSTKDSLRTPLLKG